VDAYHGAIAARAEGLGVEEAPAAIRHRELVARIDREVMAYRKAAARTQRYTFGAASSCGVFHFAWNQRQIADRLAADAHGGAGISIDQGWRHAEQLEV